MTLINGVNQMLDAILLPIGEGNRILGQVASGKVDELIAKTYEGDHEKMKQSVNNIALDDAEVPGRTVQAGRLQQAGTVR